MQDYGEFSIVDQDIAEKTLTDAQAFVDAIETYLIGTIYPGLLGDEH